ncbi:MAG TPA: hypothetical protein PLL30_01640 [Candidatus Krumholzibacteria bacterium]|nr:hypothetical protein [Candidatus Krumholzibacteria bacterium]HPD70467.1 hypothetical protein [Candidatus Krumholzibacteria bacterium]HRY39833.1 hypothetical protein [Candidatus Krumholzibacteria bacterium]
MSTPRQPRRCSLTSLILAASLLPATASPAGTTDPADAAPDSSLILTGDAEGSVLRSLTVEGENRIKFDFERPELTVDLDPAQAPGLVWGDAKDVLDRTVPDRVGPLLALSVAGLSPYRPQPWLAAFRSGPVARFRPQTGDISHWELAVVDARGEVAREFSGDKVPDEITWDGLNQQGEPATPGLTYSYVFTALDRAGNRKRYVGEGFQVPPFRLETKRGPLLVFSGADVGAGTGASAAPSPLVQEVASWLNRSLGPDTPILITVTAPSAAAAEILGERVRGALVPLLPGDPARVVLRFDVLRGGPDSGSVRVEPAA